MNRCNKTTINNSVIGRYAPSPTGDLHLGNLRTALLAWLHARVQGGQFLLRMEDLDQPRVVGGSADQILRDLEWLGLDWDGGVVYQSDRLNLYQDALDQLSSDNLVYPCFCSRKDIQQAISAPHSQFSLYPGTCANLSSEEQRQKQQLKAPSLRVRVGDNAVSFNDGCLGVNKETLKDSCGDFVIKRADGLFAYQLAVIVDDIDQEITDVVRGEDLLDSTARQIYLAKQLGAQTQINYWHVPLLLDDDGNRMSKRDGSQSILQWREQGKDASQLIAHLASSVNLIDQADSITARQLLDEISVDMLIDAVQV